LHLEEQAGVLRHVPVDIDLWLDLESLIGPEEAGVLRARRPPLGGYQK